MRKVTPESLPSPVLEASYSLGRLVLSERKAQGYSQESLALAAEVSRSTIVQIERGSPPGPSHSDVIEFEFPSPEPDIRRPKRRACA